jgi:non-ribosomal peptide synthetase-like protein
VGLLGAPSFEIPRSVRRDTRLDVTDPAELRRSLWAKNVHNTVSMALFLLTQWIAGIVLILLFLVALDLWGSLGVLVFALATVGTFFFAIAYNLLVERLLLRLQALAPQGCSIYGRAFWRHERFWKMSSVNHLNAFNGTPMKTLLWRLMGAQIGRRVFDDGGFLTERTFTKIGDDCTLNAGSVIQCHSQEDGGFKSDHTVIGAGCTLGVNAFVHYGVTMGDGAVLATDSFLMKGEEMPPDALWGGNPARRLRELPGGPQVRRTSIDGNRAAVPVHR